MVEIGDVIGAMIEQSREAQNVSSDDYRDDEGLLVCGKCGERKEEYFDFSIINETGGRREKVPRKCRCVREPLEREMKIQREQKEMARIARMRKASLMDKRLEEARFENFEVTKENQTNLKRCKKYAYSFGEMESDNQGLLLWGGIGTGKSYMAACIVNYLLDRGISAVMTSFVELIGLPNNEHTDDIFNSLKRVKLVVFDDLGTERGTDYALERVYDIVNSRYNAKKPMIVTTNLTMDEMMCTDDLRYSKIYDRIIETCYPLRFAGMSWRKRMAYKKADETMKKLDE